MPRPRIIAVVSELKSDFMARGCTEDECAELEYDETIKAMSLALEARGYKVVCIGNIEKLVEYLASGEAQTWDLVYNNAVGFRGSAREAQIPSLLEAYQIPFTGCDAATLSLCLDKAHTKMVLEHYNIRVAPFALIPARELINGIQDPNFIRDLIRPSRHGSALIETFPLFLKLNAEGSSRGIEPHSKIENAKDLLSSVNAFHARYPSHDLILETYLPGREFTVGIMGTSISAEVLGVCELTFKKVSQERLSGKEISSTPGTAGTEGFQTSLSKSTLDSDYWDIMTAPDLATDVDAQKAAVLALQTYRVIGCQDAARIDVRMEGIGIKAKPNIIEINPIYGIHPTYSQFMFIAENAGMSYGDFIEKVVTNSMKRYGI